MTTNIQLNTQEKPANKNTGSQYRKTITPIMDELYKEFCDSPKSPQFSKNIEDTDLAVTLLLRKIDVIKKITEINETEPVTNPIAKVSRLLDKVIVASLKSTPLPEDSELVVSTLKREVQGLKSEVTKIKKQTASEVKTFTFNR